MELTTSTSTDLGHLTRKLELDSLRLFSVVCREGSYAKAARIEPLTASAISKRIAELEKAMGCVLLERSNYGVKPTVAGELVLSQWADVAASLAPLMSTSDSMSLPEQVQLALVADPDASRFLVFDCLSNVDALDDAAKVAVTRAQASWLPVEFEKLSMHAAIWSLSPSGGDERNWRQAETLYEKFQGTRLFRFCAEVCVAAVRNDHPLAPLGLISGEDLEEYELVCSAGMLPQAMARSCQRQPGLGGTAAMPRIARPSWSHQVGSTLEYLDTVPSGTVALLPTSARYLMHRFPGLRCLTLTEDQGCMDFGCALRDDAWLNDRVRLIEKLSGCQLTPVKLAEEPSAWGDGPQPEMLDMPAAVQTPVVRAAAAAL